MVDAVILFLILSYSVFLINRIFRKKTENKGCCSGSCIGCTGCSAEKIERMIREAEKNRGDGK